MMTRTEVVSAIADAAQAEDGNTAPHYRAYAVDRTGRLPAYVEVEAEDDAEAVRLTGMLAEFYPIELWHGARLLGRFDRRNRAETAEADAKRRLAEIRVFPRPGTLRRA